MGGTGVMVWGVHSGGYGGGYRGRIRGAEFT